MVSVVTMTCQNILSQVSVSFAYAESVLLKSFRRQAFVFIVDDSYSSPNELKIKAKLSVNIETKS